MYAINKYDRHIACKFLNSILMEINEKSSFTTEIEYPDFYKNKFTVVDYVLKSLDFYGLILSNYTYGFDKSVLEKGLIVKWKRVYNY